MKITGEQYFELAVETETARQGKNGLFACPCCERYSFAEAGGYEICGACGWEDDPVQEAKPDLAGGANKVSLLQARANYRTHGFSDPARIARLRKLP
ncbi:peptide methionine sulfoxide reductase MsrB [Rhizobium sp. SG_E_25_P2]|uniref:CPCC family cysteine-rich protein n=1 Tax=Rhizobium sp. SG_E_25_P2 TaxID=2879942 RepID=UPI0024768F9E|nr:CPCC family cysteine-rich protein [Rhizobium sp. SG_E_25_P2]MDH6267563.1 peptide methionine sulfoxide reductase MsrB [Rhizobium sp. SG_E_25_P2]